MGQSETTVVGHVQPEKHRPLADLGDALVFLEEIEFAMRHAPIKQHNRTPEEQEAVERLTTYWVWIRDVLGQHWPEWKARSALVPRQHDAQMPPTDSIWLGDPD